MQKFGVSILFFVLIEINTFIKHRHSKLVKTDSKEMYNFTKDINFK